LNEAHDAIVPRQIAPNDARGSGPKTRLKALLAAQ
jgi:hypothetical protein